MSFDQLVSLVVAAAAVVTLYFAWRTVVEARGAAREQDRDRLMRQLERLTEICGAIGRLIDNVRFQEAEMERLMLVVAVAPVEEDLPETRALALCTFTLESYPADRALVRASLDEIQETVLTLPELVLAPRWHSKLKRLWRKRSRGAEIRTRDL